LRGHGPQCEGGLRTRFEKGIISKDELITKFKKLDREMEEKRFVQIRLGGIFNGTNLLR
jgi:hypothetical protein